MTSPRIQRRVERLLDQAEDAANHRRWADVQALAREALSLDEGNQDASALIRSAAAMLVASDPAAGDATAPAQSTARAATLPASFAAGRYLVRRFLGEGGKKRVYLAHDTLLDRDVAFALIKADGLDPGGRERVTREAQAMGRLGSHPNIVSVFDMGEEPVGAPRQVGAPGAGVGPGPQPYIVTEYMAGGDVEDLIARAPDHRLLLDRAIKIATEVCHGLDFAHAHGVIHRDLKPGNVWLTEDRRQTPEARDRPLSPGERVRVRGTPPDATQDQVAKIGDFGLAVAVDRSRLTQAGMMVGTVSYMPPEQALGGEVGPRSDLYSLGAMLYEMVCGRPPFVGDDSVAIIGQHLNTPPIAPSLHRRLE